MTEKEQKKVKQREKKKEKQLKKLRTVPIGSAIAFFAVAQHLFILVPLATLIGIMVFLIGVRMQPQVDKAVNIGRTILEAGSEAGVIEALDELEKEAGPADAVLLIDGDGNVLDGFGEPTFIFGEPRKTSGEYESEIYLDSETDFGTALGEPALKALVIASSPLVISANKDSSTAAELFDDIERNVSGSVLVTDDSPKNLYIWVGLDVSDTQTLMVRGSVYYYLYELVIAIGAALYNALIMMVLTIFTMVNLIKTVKNRIHTTQLIYTDVTTGGKSWLYFEQKAADMLYRRRSSGKLYAVVDITLMKYRSYCICHGMAAGEALLADIDRQLGEMVGKKNFSVHFEKADFALFILCKDKEEGVARVNDMLCKLPELLGHGGNLVFHAGICFVPTGKTEGSISGLKRDDINVAEYYNRASSARASIADENQAAAATFDQVLLEKQLWEHKVEERMNDALKMEEFKVYIQPKYNPVTEKLSGAEALVRWINDEDGFISPGKFIPIFEENGFIVKLDDYMISHVAALQAKWLAEGKNVVPISVNVSRAHFANPDLASHICELVDAHKVPHHLIEIELTESAFFDDKAALLSTVGQLHDLGFEVSMDDFGAGYSSLNSLKDLPLDVLKLDAEFFRGEGGAERGEIVVAQAINLAKQLNMRIVAEGVEKKEQVDFLAGKDCDMIQGFYFAKPMPTDEYEERL